MNFREMKALHQRKLAEIIGALNAHGLHVDNYHVRRLAWLMNFHLTHHNIRLTAYDAGKLLKLEIAEALVKTKGRGHIYVMFNPSMN